MNPLKLLEIAVAGYIGSVGALFLIDTDVLSAPVYKEWQHLGQLGWALILLGVAALHFTCLYLNGRKPSLSYPIRFLAILLHFGVCLQFAAMFFSVGAVWGTLTYLILMPALLIIIGQKLMSQTLQAVNNERVT